MSIFRHMDHGLWVVGCCLWMIGHVGKNRRTFIFWIIAVWSESIFRLSSKNRNSQILLALSNIWTLNFILFSWSTSVGATDVAHATAWRNHVVTYGLTELLHEGLQLELKWLSSVELDEQLMELCSVWLSWTSCI